MAGIFPLAEWRMSAGYIVEYCEGRGEDPRIVLAPFQNPR